MKPGASSSKIFYLLFTLVSLFVLLSFTSCCNDEGNSAQTTKPISQDVKSELDIDVNDPVAVNTLILTEGKKGNDAVKDALVAHKRIRQDEYELKGDQARGVQNYEEAINNYKDALEWSDKADRRADLYRKMAESWVAYGLKGGGIDKQLGYQYNDYRNANEFMEKAAENEPDNNKKAMYYLQAANYRSIADTKPKPNWDNLEGFYHGMDICRDLSNAFRYAKDQKLLDKITDAKQKANCK